MYQLNHFAVHLKLTQFCKSTVLQFKKKNIPVLRIRLTAGGWQGLHFTDLSLVFWFWYCYHLVLMKWIAFWTASFIYLMFKLKKENTLRELQSWC